jgi:hypothetical protein
MNDIIAVPGLSPDVAGAITYWRLSGATDLARLGDAWRASAIDPGQFPLPLSPSPETALRKAVQEQGSKRLLVRPLEKQKGWALVEEKATGDDLNHAITCRVKLAGHAASYVGFPVVEPADHALAQPIRAEFDRAISEVDAGATSGWLVRTIYKLQAVALRDTGGIYFVPRPMLPAWRQIALAVREATAHAVFEIPALRSTEAIDAVLDAVSQEAQTEADKMEKALDEGQLGARALFGRSERCQETLAKIEQYEDLLGRGLDTIKERIGALKSNLVAAALMAQDADGPGAV